MQRDFNILYIEAQGNFLEKSRGLILSLIQIWLFFVSI